MKVAIDLRFSRRPVCIAYKNFTLKVISQLARGYPDSQFLVIDNERVEEQLLFPVNMVAAGIENNDAGGIGILSKFLEEKRFSKTLRNMKADVLLAANGRAEGSFDMPQVLAIHDLAFLAAPNFLESKIIKISRKATVTALQNARQVLVPTQSLKQSLVQQMQVDPSVVNVTGIAAGGAFVPATWDEKEAVKKVFTNGKEYFLYYGSLDSVGNLLNLLKAFSIFKKRQLSNMQLVIMPDAAEQSGAILQLLETYKYRQEVLLLNESLTHLVSAAYAIVFPGYYSCFPISAFEAMQAGVPVIASSLDSLQQVCGDAALYADPSSTVDIANQLKVVYKDEQLRSRMIENGRQLALAQNFEKVAAVYWDCLVSAISSPSAG